MDQIANTGPPASVRGDSKRLDVAAPNEQIKVTRPIILCLFRIVPGSTPVCLPAAAIFGTVNLCHRFPKRNGVAKNQWTHSNVRLLLMGSSH